ncbi:HlyD family efflux transporter periplasmic adaptor subunit [Candidatus Dojkabacteria bacterium]|nr:HlyD family efflux transporter periplasmic adaptor subunit [Candidatus Dojkabacteria bacterium]
MLNPSKLINKKYFRITILSILLLATVGVLITSILTKTEPPIPNRDEVAIEKVYAVEVIAAGKVDSFTSSIAKATNKNEMTLKAITQGVVSDLQIEEGDKIDKGNKILQIADNYSGDKSIDVQIEIAGTQIEKAKKNKDDIKNQYNDRKNLAEETYDDYISTLELNRTKVKSLQEQINITEGLRDDINALIDEYEDFENDIEDYYEDMDQDFLADQGVLQNKGAVNSLKAASKQYDSTLISLNDQLDQIKYETGSNYPGNQTAEINRNLTIAQLKLQQDMADIDVQLAELNLELLSMQKDIYTQRSPISGRIERVLIKEGDLINPGQEIAIISGKTNLVLTTLVTPDLINKIDSSEKAVTIFDSKEYTAKIKFISTTTVDNGFYEIKLEPESKLAEQLTTGSSIKLEFKLKVETDSENNYIYIPVDTVFKTNTSEYVLVAENGLAIQKGIKTADIIGDQIRVTDGLVEGDLIIKDRRIIPNQKISIIKDTIGN